MVESVLRRVYAGGAVCRIDDVGLDLWNWVAERKVLTHVVLREMRGVRII